MDLAGEQTHTYNTVVVYSDPETDSKDFVKNDPAVLFLLLLYIRFT